MQLSGELDHHSAEQTRIMLDTLLRDVTVHELVLDLSGMTFMDSAGIGVILGRFRKISMRGGRMVVKGMNASVDRLFQMSGIYAIVERQ